MATDKMKARARRHIRVRKKVKGTAERPRLCVFKSARHISAQVIDDAGHVTLVGVSSTAKGFDCGGHCGNIQAAAKLGEIIGKKALDKGIKKVVFDRGGNIYHGRLKAVADAARKSGLEF